MDFIRQLIAFDDLSAGTLTPNAMVVYLKLFMINNRCHWEEWFETSDYWLKLQTGIKRKETIVAALNLLRQKGFIEFQRGGAGRPSKYKLVDLSKCCPQGLLNSPTYAQSNSHGLLNSPSSSPSSSPSNSPSFENPLIKENKKVNVKGNVKRGTRFVPPTLSEVNEYVIEKNLHVSAKKFWEYYDAGSWKDAKGNPVRNWKQKILTWDSHEKKPAPQAASPQNDIDRAIEYFESQEEGTA